MGKRGLFVFICPVERVYISFHTLIYLSICTSTLTRIKSVFMVFLTMAEIARILICVKGFVSYETGEWKYLKLSHFS